jgi:hypothetical protein
MLYVNDVKFVLGKSEHKKLEEFVGNRFPVTIKFADQVLSKSTQQGKIKKKPGGILIPYESVIYTNDGTEKWNYTVVPPVSKQAGVLEYYSNSPGGELFGGVKHFHKKDSELLYYLVFCTPFVAGGEHTKSPLIAVDDKKRAAEIKNTYRRKKSQVESALFGDKAIHMDDVIRIAKAFGVGNADNMTDDEVRDALFTAIEARQNDKLKADGYAMFNELSDNPDRVKALSSIQILKDNKRFAFNNKSKEWSIVDESGKKIHLVGAIMANRTNDEALEKHILDNKQLLEMVADLAYELSKDKALKQEPATA